MEQLRRQSLKDRAKDETNFRNHWFPWANWTHSKLRLTRVICLCDFRPFCQILKEYGAIRRHLSYFDFCSSWAASCPSCSTRRRDEGEHRPAWERQKSLTVFPIGPSWAPSPYWRFQAGSLWFLRCILQHANCTQDRPSATPALPLKVRSL